MPRVVLCVQLSVTAVTLAVGAAISGSDVAAAAQLPVPCGAGVCNTNSTTGFTTPPQGFVTYGKASYAQSGNTATITQSTNQAILNWASFNISADGKVVFQQPNAASVALNKIYQQSPSAIFGQLSANGQIYLVNPNGFIFGQGATVNAAGLIASSLGLYDDDPEFENSTLFSQSTQAPYNPALGTPDVIPGTIVVQPGASISVADQGDILLAGETVTNGGSLSAPDGQIVLAAGQTAYLTTSSNPLLRGLIVEVTGQGQVNNQAGGVLSAPRGNVSLVGLAVNQDGIISATTAVSSNGSVILEAADGGASGSGTVTCQTGETLCATQGGVLSIGSTSQVSIQPDASQGTAAVAQAQNQSQIQLTGLQVDLDGQISAPDGALTVTAAVDPDLTTQSIDNSAAQIRMAAGASIDLAGSQADLPMSANLLSIQLLANELEDDPQQRNGALHGQTVIVDVRDGDPALISASSWESELEGIQESIYQRTATGGTANFLSQGDILFSSGASLNVSGGAWNYAAGVTQTSELVAAGGQTYNISSANPALTYTKVINPTYTQTYSGYGIQVTQPMPGLGHYESAYSEGLSAGSVTFAAPTMALQGTLAGSAVDGLYQRNAASIPATSLAALVAWGNSHPNALSSADPFPDSGAAAIATGGTLQIGEPVASLTTAGLPEFFAPAVTIVSTPAPISAARGAALAPQPLQVPAGYLTSDGFATTDIYSDSTVTLPAGLPLNLGAGGSLQIVAPSTVIDSNVQALDGSIGLYTAQTTEYQSSGPTRPGVDIGDGVTLNVSGQWTNDSIDAAASPLGPTYQNGGSIVLSLTSPYDSLMSGGALDIGNGVSLLANGGAWVQYTNTVTGGTGGSITLDASPYQAAVQVGNGVAVQAFGVQGALGGAFTFNAPRIAVVAGNDSWSAAQQVDDLNNPGGFFDVGAALFSQDGFSDINLTATAPVAPGAASNDVLTVTGGTTIAAQAQSLQLESGVLTHPTGGTIQGLADAQLLPEAQQQPFAIQFNVAPASTDPNTTLSGDLDIQVGSSLMTGPGSTVTLEGQGSVLIDGAIRAPGGAIIAQIQNPNAVLLDPGYLPDQRLQLGSGSVLDVSGVMVPTLNTLALPLGSVLAGGSVELQADRGEILADPGSLIDIAGASAPLDVRPTQSTGYQLTMVGSAGGSLVVQSSESVSLRGNLSAAAGASSSGALDAGSLQLNLSAAYRGPVSPFSSPFPSSPYTIDLVSSTTDLSPSSSDANLAVVGISQLEQSDIDELLLQADSTVELGSNSTLSLGRKITLDAPSIAVDPGVSATLEAPYVAFNDSQQLTSALQPSAGTGTLTVSAGQIVLSSFTTLQGVQTATLNSTGDVEFEPLNLDYLAGGLALAGNLNIDAARVYPATEASYTIDATGGTVAIAPPVGAASNNPTPSTPLSANGSFTINANDIVSSGTLLAPFGQLTLNATNSLSLLAGSITSVSADGTVIPYGQTALGGEEWVYAQASGQEIGVPGVPTRTLSLSGAQISVASGATIDVSGGGDLSAYEWVPGTGGSVDALSQASAAAAGYYAVLPSLQGRYAAYDLQEFSGSSVSAGENVYLSGSVGLPAGVYTLLPARYALLPGAFLIQVQSGYQSLTAGTLGTLPTGAPVVAGYLTFGNTSLHQTNGYSGFAIYPGGPDADTSYAQSLAQYTINNAASYFGASAADAGQAVPLPADAGTLMFDIGSTLSLLGNVKASAAPGGTGATIDLYTAPGVDLTVSASPQSSAGGGVTIAAPSIAAWDAGDLLLGGMLSADGTSIDVTAGTVTIGAGAQVSADQVLVVADQGIDVQSGAAVASTSGLSGTALKALPTSQTLSLESGSAGSEQPDPNAALLAVSDLELPSAQRSGSASGGATITIESGATLATRGAVVLDAPAGVSVSDDAAVNAPGASWSLGSDSIAFVGSGGTSTDTLLIDAKLLSQMQSAAAIRLASAGAIDLLTSVTLGAAGVSSAPSLDSLTLSGATVNNAGGNSAFGAQTVTLEGIGPGSGVGSLPSATSGNGSLTLTAGTLAIGGTGSLVINGDGETTLQATNQVLGQGGTLAIGGNAAIAAPDLTATGDTSTALAVQGLLQIQQSGMASANTALTGSLGGALALSAQQIQDSGSIIVPGGTISLQAAGDISLGDGTGAGADVDAGGIDVSAVGNTYGAAGGIVDINAHGSLSLSNATLNVAGAGSSPAGFLTLTSGGTFSLSGGSLNGSASAGATGGSFTLDAAQLSGGLAVLPTDPSGAILAGFTNQIDVHVGSGDLDLAAGASLNANQVNLTTDTGSIDLAGIVSAPSAGVRGSIGLFAGNNVVLQSSGQLLANGSASNGGGGEIELSAGNPATGLGSITLMPGGVISATGQAQNGTLWLRAPSLTTSAAIGIDGDLAASVGSGNIDVGQIILEPVLAPIQSNADFTTDFTSISSLVSNYLTQVQTNGGLPASLQVPSGPTMVFEPGVVVRATGDLTLGQSGQVFDLTQQGLGAPIDLTVQASGSINIDGSISGFTLSDSNDAGAASSTLRFVAGANLTSADPLATGAGSQANLALGTGAIVQTGSGDLDLVASNDVTFASGASAYTTGGANSASVPIKIGSVAEPVYFATGGGNLDVQAGNDIVGTPTQASIASWQARTDSCLVSACVSNVGVGEWGANLTAFDANPWSLATFGGGDLRITAGGDLQNVSAASADSMLLDSTGTVQTHYSSGGLTISVTGNVTNGQYFVADGAGTLNIGRSLLTTTSTTTTSTPAGSLFGLDDSSWSIWAQGDVSVDAVVNPTILPQPQATSGGIASLVFFTYGPNSSFDVQSTSGSVSIADSDHNLRQLLGNSYAGTSNKTWAFLLFPSTLELTSLSHDVEFESSQITLAPSSSGQLALIAGQDIVDPNIVMSDATDAVLSTASHVLPGVSGVSTLVFPLSESGVSAYDFYGDVHAHDPTPASIVAGRDIEDLTLSIPKQADIEAGGNIVDLDYIGQNINPTDLTLIYAGGSVTDAPSFDPTSGALTNGVSESVQIGGPGSVDVLAGQDINLGFSGGVTAVGNLANGSLPAGSADVAMAAGLGQSPAYASFLQQVVEPSAAYQQQLIGYVESLTGQGGLSASQADAEFAALDSNQQSPFIYDVFFNELSLSGQEANTTPSLGYSRGYAAIADLFPGSPTGSNGNSSTGNPDQGDLDLTYSAIESEQGGNISLLAPGGAINVGLAEPPGSLFNGGQAKQPSQLGIIAQGGGNVDVYSQGSVNVNSSRIFAVGGGNILIWSEEGNIDAGQGAKSSLSIPPPTIVVNPSTGQVTLDYSNAVAGSGIRTLQTDPTQPAGNVNLIAPVGSVNAGDAGIGAAGNINIAAAVVTGVANINFGGTATGVPALVSNVSASLSGAASTASAATTSATSSLEQSAAGNQTQQAPLAQAAISWLDVFVTGLGLQNCSPDDTQCLQQEQQQSGH